MKLLDGKIASAAIKKQIALQVSERIDAGRVAPHLVAILVGSDGASETYVASKIKNCELVGIKSSLYRLDVTVTEERLKELITSLNNDPSVHGILVQLPLPGQLNEEAIIQLIHPDKDVDGFHPVNVGKLMLGLPGFVSATPQGIILLLEYYNIETAGKHAVVIGRSNIVGRPMSVLLSRNTEPGNCTVTICHSRTKNLASICRQADIVVAALGKPAFLKADMVKEGAVIIDVGITRVADALQTRGYKIIGDVDYNEVCNKAAYLTPVPGGVGLMTIAALLQNTLIACALQEQDKKIAAV